MPGLIEPGWRTGIRSVAAALNKPFARRRLQTLLAATPSPYMIELGSGPVEHPGWIRTDVGYRSKYYLDATGRWPVPDGTVSHVYADNVIEHLPLAAGRALLENAYRSLAPGGRIRLVTPDVEQLARAYLEATGLNERMLARNRSVYPDVRHPADNLRVTFCGSGHHLGYIYDYEALCSELIDAGFSDVRRYEVGISDDPRLRNLEERSDSPSADFQLVVEAIRGKA